MNNKNLLTEKQNIINLFNKKKFNKISNLSPKTRALFEDQPDIVKIIVMSELNCNNFINPNPRYDLLNLFLSSFISHLALLLVF